MIYFYHHYELPFVLQRHNLQQFIMAQQTAATNDSVSFMNTTGRHDEDDSNVRSTPNRSTGTSGGSSSVNEEVTVELRSRNEVRSIFSNITRRLVFRPLRPLLYRRRTTHNPPTPETSDSITQTSAFYADQQVTRSQYVNEEPGAMFTPEQIQEPVEEMGASGSPKTTNVMNSSFSPDIIASTSKNIISSPDVVTSSTDKTPAVASTTDYRQNRSQTTINSSTSPSNVDKRYSLNENPNDSNIGTQNDDDASARLEAVNILVNMS